MSWLRAAFRELFSLFVDDIRYSSALVGWIGVATLGVPRLEVARNLGGPILFLGCAVILIAASAWTAHRQGTGT